MQYLDILTTLGTSIAGALFLAIIFRAPPRYLVPIVTVSCLPGIALDVLADYMHADLLKFAVAISVSCLAHVMARFTRKPAQMFLIPGVFFLLPGSTIYRSLTAFLQSDSQMAFTLLIQAIIASCAVSFGVLIANWIVPSKQIL